MLRFEPVTEANFSAIVRMKRPEEEHFVASNTYSLAQAWLYRSTGLVHPFALCLDDAPVGFLMLREDPDARYLLLWRILFPPEHQCRGYGTEAIRRVIHAARASGKFDFLVLDCEPSNEIALHVYQKLGFRPTRNFHNGEMVLRLDL